jgi:serine/threonine-protein kinase HipA
MSPSESRAGSTRRQVDVVLDADLLPAPQRVGVLFHAAAHGGGVFSFRYDQNWLRHANAFEIDPELSLHEGESYPGTASGAFRILLDSAPDRWGRALLERREIIRARDEKRQPRVLTEWDYLLGVHDSCRLGALRFRRDERSSFLDDDAHHAAPPLSTLRELEAAAAALEDPNAADNPQFREWLTQLLTPGSSLGGARPKANFTAVDGSLWIAKFPSKNDRRDVGAWEMVLHALSLKAGLTVPAARLLKLESGHRTFACQRFDRLSGGRRRFFVSAMTMLDKNDGDGGSYLELAEFLSTRGSAAHRKRDLRELWMRVVFNLLVSNTDDHLRNHGFILEGDGWRLAPAYDVNPNVERLAHTLAIDERDGSPDLQLAMDTAEYYLLKPADARKLLESTKAAVRGWAQEASRLGIPRSEIEGMRPAFSNHGA